MLGSAHKIDSLGTQSLSVKEVPIADGNSNTAVAIKMRKSSFDKKAQDTAQSFETAFIAQMLQFSGLAKALTVGGGEGVESFTQFYLEELAKDISDNGGFGIADKIKTYIEKKEETHGELGKL